MMTSSSLAQTEKQAVIHGIELDDNKVKIQVTSTGCTNNDAFELRFKKGSMLVLRTKLDKCRRMPHKIWLSFELPSKTTELTLMNKLSL